MGWTLKTRNYFLLEIKQINTLYTQQFFWEMLIENNVYSVHLTCYFIINLKKKNICKSQKPMAQSDDFELTNSQIRLTVHSY